MADNKAAIIGLTYYAGGSLDASRKFLDALTNVHNLAQEVTKPTELLHRARSYTGVESPLIN